MPPKTFTAAFAFIMLMLTLMAFSVSQVGAAPPPAMSADAATFTITDLTNGDNEKEGYVFDKLLFSGKGYKETAEIQIVSGDTVIAKTESAKDGSFSVDYRWPETAGGTYDIYAADGNEKVYASFTILPSIFFTPNFTAAGTSVMVTGNGFSQDPLKDGISGDFEGIKLMIHDPFSDGNPGNFNAFFVVPNVELGPHTVTFSLKSDPEIAASATFNVSPDISVTPENPVGALAALFACIGAVVVFKERHRIHI